MDWCHIIIISILSIFYMKKIRKIFNLKDRIYIIYSINNGKTNKRTNSNSTR